MRFATKQRVTVLATMISVLLVAGVAFAAWTSTATGSGSASSLTHTDTFTGIVSETPGTGLYPGDTANVVVTITNSQSYPVTVDSIGGGTSDSLTGCAAGSVDTTATTPDVDLAPGASDEFTVVATMDSDAAEGCAGQTFTFPLTAVLSSN